MPLLKLDWWFRFPHSSTKVIRFAWTLRKRATFNASNSSNRFPPPQLNRRKSDSEEVKRAPRRESVRGASVCEKEFLEELILGFRCGDFSAGFFVEDASETGVHVAQAAV